MELAELELPSTSRTAESHATPPSQTAHRELRRDEYWRGVPAFSDVDAATFHSHTFQARNSVTSVGKLMRYLGNLVPADFYRDVSEGLRRAPMSIRISPHILSLVDWRDPYADPLRNQFLPLGSQQLPDHPEVRLDSLDEQSYSPVPGLAHRYPDRALLLALDTCPVYCRFCTRSYAVGLDTEGVEKVHLSVNRQRWDAAFEYIAAHPEVEDVVVSGGDTYNLKADQILLIGETLLGIDHIRRIRFGTKGLAVMPQKILTDSAWVDALSGVADAGRRVRKHVAVHTHFNHPNEITGATEDAMDRLCERGITVRNQTVLQRRVNDNAETMKLLVKRLSYLSIHPYYVFFHDLVRGVEDLRTTLADGLEIEKEVRGATAGFNTPTFVVDTMGGGGKRNGHSYEHYNRETGIAVYTSPSVRPGALFLYLDPLDCLDEAVQERWADLDGRREMIDAALAAARSGQR